MYEVQKYLTLWNYCYDADLVIANSKVWDSLDEKTQDLLKECIAEACEWGNEKIVEDEKTLIEKFKDNGMQVDELTDEQLEPFKELIKEPMNEIKAKYGKDACEAFGIDTEGVKFSN